MADITSDNSFNEAVNMDSSDLTLKNTMARNMMNMRIINLHGTSFCVTNMKGTEERFQLSAGFIPLASEDFNEVLYVISYNPTTLEVELGSFPSPNYVNPSIPNNNLYRPFNNLDDGPFRTAQFGISSKPRITDVEIQPDYDGSVNVLFTMSDKTPRIVNSKFRVLSDVSGNRVYEPTADRPGTANSNEYTSTSVEKETRQILSSDKVLNISFLSLSGGGKLKPGNYSYVFYYMTEDFSRTDIVGQSGLCQVSFGSTETNQKGGDETQETNKKVSLTLTNIDTDFKYLKVFALYSSGQETNLQQFLEFTNPITITSESMTFTHTGFEELAEVSQDIVNTEFSTIESAVTNTQIDGYYMLGGIKERSYDFTDFKTAGANLVPEFATKEIVPTTFPGYGDPGHVYDSLGYFGDESYPLGIVFVMPGNVLSPVFPTKGRHFQSAIVSGSPAITNVDQGNGVITFPSSNHYLPTINGRPQAKYIKFDVSGVPQEIKDASIGFFFVRGERNPWLLSQGVMAPVVRVANTEYVRGGGGTGYYYDIYNTDAELSAYGFVPCIDSLLEAYALDEIGTSEDPDYVVDEFFQISAGYMPIYINDMRELYGSGAVQNFSTKHWALLSGEAFADEPGTVTNLLRDSAYIFQMGKIGFQVGGTISPIFDDSADPAALDVGLHYAMQSFSRYDSPGYKLANSINFVPPETFGSGSDFISRAAQRYRFISGGSERGYDVFQSYNPYFGVEMTDDLLDITKNAQNPYGGNTRIASVHSTDGAHTSGTRYANYNSVVNAGFLVNVYPSNVRPAATELYPNVDTIIYKQVTKRYTWADAASQGNVIDVFGGDCYISKVSRKLNQSGFRNPGFAEGPFRRANIDSGTMLTWWQESKYNLQLRQPGTFDASETEERSFFPYKGRGDFNEFRRYRYPETARHSKGYSEVLPPRSLFPLPDNAPFIQSDFFSRVMASDKHVPNAFRNGYRSFTGINFRDYDSSLGRIIRLFNHRNNLLVVFEHGIGVGSVNQRIQTGSDASGSIFVESKDILPPKLDYWSRTLGSQSFYSMVQTPFGIYGVDEEKRKLWQATDKVAAISDVGFMSFLEGNQPINPRTGYNPDYKEVTFTTDNWTLIFQELQSRFYFMSFKPSYYTKLGKQMLSFTDRFHTHSGTGFSLYGNPYEYFVEFVVNKDVAAVKVFDWLNLVSNEVKPNKVEFFTYSGIPQKPEVITPSGCHQYSKVLDIIDPYLQEPIMEWRDKGWLIQIPNTEVYNPIPGIDDWEVDGRMRNRYLIVRITYNAQSALQLLAVLTNYRYSSS